MTCKTEANFLFCPKNCYSVILGLNFAAVNKTCDSKIGVSIVLPEIESENMHNISLYGTLLALIM